MISFSCERLVPDNEEVLARVGSTYLYRKDLNRQLNSFVSFSDSTLKANIYIDNWARNQLLNQQAKLNLPESDINALENLVKEYRQDLYNNTYRKVLLNKYIDTLVSISEINSFLFKNKEIFKLKAPLYQVRYIHLPPGNVDQYEIQRSFQRFNNLDQKFLDSLSFQYYSYLLSDSLWLNKNNLTTKVRFINQDNFDKYTKKSQFFKIEDTMGVYLFFVKEFLRKGDLAPSTVFTPTIKKILLNKRKLDFTKEFEKDILQDAIQSNTFEIY